MVPILPPFLRLGLLIAALLVSVLSDSATKGAIAGGAGEGAFVSVIEDLPVMPGLEERTDSAVYFDAPGGRIAEALLQGDVAADTVRAFYAETLPQLGWRPAEDDSFIREGESLQLRFEQAAGTLNVGLALSPLAR